MYLQTPSFGKRYRVASSFAALALAVLSLTALATNWTRGALPTTIPSLDWGKLPIHFEPNVGQASPPAQFVAHAPGGTLYFAPSEVMLSLPSGEVRLTYAGANPEASMSGGEALPGKVNYFLGSDPAHWRTNLSTYAGIHYHSLYNGISLTYEGTGGTLKGTYTLAPHADPSLIRWQYTGSQSISIDAVGNLQITLPSVLSPQPSVLTESAPIAWQEIDGSRVPVSASYQLAADGTVSFALGSYDPAYPLTIDPTLTYSTFLGGSSGESIVGVQVDAQGNIYVAGQTDSSDFPTQDPIQPALRGSYDVFISKLNPAGNALIYSTYLGGSQGDEPYGMAIDPAGNVYVTGETQSEDYPTANAFQPSKGYYFDAFVTKLSASGSSLVYSTYLGGSLGMNGSDAGMGIAADAAGNAYVTGETASTDFPVTASFQPTHGGSYDAFVTKFNPTGSTLAYSTFLGGDSFDQGMAIAVDGAGSAYVTGRTDSEDFPLASPIQPTPGAGQFDSDAFVTKLNASGTALVYSTYLGGSNNEPGYNAGIAVDNAGNAYVTGNTESLDFPTANPYQGGLLGQSDAYLTKINASGSALDYSTYFGGIGFDGGYAVAADASGNAYLTGSTSSNDLPLVDPVQSTYNGGLSDAFVTAFGPSGASPFYSTYLGGASTDKGYSITVNGAGNTFVVGYTGSANFPVTSGAYQPTKHGYMDGFISKLHYVPVATPTGTPPTATPRPPTITHTPTVTNTPNPCGLNWNVVPSPAEHRYHDIEAISASNVWAVGYSDVGQQSSIAHWDGTQWTSVPHPNPGALTNLLYGLEAIASDDIWAVGSQNSTSSNFEFTALHWDGTTWTDFEMPLIPQGQGYYSRHYLYEVSALASDDIWAVGAALSDNGYKAVTLHWDGAEWSVISILNLGSYDTVLKSVISLASDDVWAVGYYGITGYYHTYRTLTMHWDGSAWTVINSPNPGGAGDYNALYDVDAVSPNELYAVGAYSDYENGLYDRTLVLRWDGTAWNQVPSPNVGTGDGGLAGIDVISANDIWAVGSGLVDPFNGEMETLTIHWDGVAWTRVASPNRGSTYNDLNAVSAVSSTDVWAAGYIGSGSFSSYILRYSDACATPEPTATGTVPTNTPTRTRTPTSTRTNTPVATPTICGLAYPLIEGFEGNGNDLGAFVAEAPICPDFCGWAPNVSRIHSGLRSAHGPDVGQVSDQQLVTASAIDLPDDATSATLTFWHNYVFDMHFDGGVLEGSTDGGATWFDLEDNITSGGYDGALSSVGGNPLAGRAAWTGSNGPDFTQVSVDLSPFAGQSLLFRFRIGTDISIGSLGWWIDDVQVRVDTPCGGSTATPGTPLPTATNTPTTEPTTEPQACAITFTDVPMGSTFYAPIMCVACMGYVSGYPDGTFRPNDNVTRGQLAKIVANVAQLRTDLSGQTFEDVPPGSTFYTYIEAMAQAGYIAGYPCGGPGEPCGPNNLPYYRPSARATRGQLTKIVANTAQLVGGPQPQLEPMFADVPQDSPFYMYAQAMGMRAFMQGYPCGGPGEPCGPNNLPYFRPALNATRGQTAKIVTNAFYSCAP